ncbi:hypothetical protein E2C01_099672 [Portunus trituberculatus]|uniref:Uncharacterized protein n=1 Tax=Portunus trituberculatus TaxID=210409 RepID=A0A5B7KHF4_PORTR|nr:hypothetical protein [Portunus trituberculatus]
MHRDHRPIALVPGAAGRRGCTEIIILPLWVSKNTNGGKTLVKL